MPVAPDLSGCALDDRYELHAVLGEGAFGRVYRGMDRRLARPVAVKVIKPWWSEDPEWVEAFEREAQLLARVSNPGIVQIFDVGQAEEGLYYVSELIEGESLQHRLRRGPIPAPEAAALAEQLCRGLAEAHAQRIIHRDVKPANILISDDGRVKVGDFGVARLAEGSSDAALATVVGTPRYMAPEQANGSQISPATDVYSAGVVLYEMLAGAPPFTGTSVAELALSHLQAPPPPLPRSIPAPLEAIVSRALRKDPAGRYVDAGAMAEALVAAINRMTDATTRRPQPRTAGNGRPAPIAINAPTASARRTTSLAETTSSARTTVNRTVTAPPRPRTRRWNPAARRRTLALFGFVAVLIAAGVIVGTTLNDTTHTVRVPPVHGLSRAAVEHRARRAGLNVRFSERYDSSVAQGDAISESPRQGRRADRGSTVAVALSRGPQPVPVPKLVTLSSTDATTILDGDHLRAKIVPGPDPGTRPGTVYQVSPPAGHELLPGSTVTLDIAETPTWQPPEVSFQASGPTRSDPFTIRGDQWRVVYSMEYDGLCQYLFLDDLCSGPTVTVVDASDGAIVTKFGMTDAAPDQTHVIKSGPGTYQLQISGGNSASYAVKVQDDF